VCEKFNSAEDSGCYTTALAERRLQMFAWREYLRLALRKRLPTARRSEQALAKLSTQPPVPKIP